MKTRASKLSGRALDYAVAHELVLSAYGVRCKDDLIEDGDNA